MESFKGNPHQSEGSRLTEGRGLPQVGSTCRHERTKDHVFTGFEGETARTSVVFGEKQIR